MTAAHSGCDNGCGAGHIPISNTAKFTGPVFIVGMPRSGTQLLRDLLNQNPKIGIPNSESGFIPYMVNRFGNPPRFANARGLDEFYKEFSRTTFFWNMSRKGRVLRRKDLNCITDKKSWSNTFAFIYRFYAPDGRDKEFIWGDKTPLHVKHLQLLKELYPEAKFLHIIRDPRDYCLSVKKTWGKSILRAAHIWRATLEKARADSHQLGQDYLEVKYECLLANPTKVSCRIAEFLGCDQFPWETRLVQSPNIIGKKREKVEILRDNLKKYVSELSSAQIKRIEEIVYPVASTIGYKCDAEVMFKPVNALTLQILTLCDAFASVRYYSREKGLYDGLRYIYRFHRRKR
jgi:hypothetical protein